MPGTLPLVAVAIVVVLIGAVAFIALQERSARGTKRRAKRGSKKFAAGLGLGVAGLAGILEGLGEGAASGVGEIGAVVLAHPSFVVDLSLIGLGTFALTGDLPVSVPVFLFVCFGIIALGLALDKR